jgi:hypothetical protein
MLRRVALVRTYFNPKLRFLQKPNSVTSQKTASFIENTKFRKLDLIPKRCAFYFFEFRTKDKVQSPSNSETDLQTGEAEHTED